VTAWRMLWRDWGFAPTLFSQAEHFLELAERSENESPQEGFIRASIVFFLISFEAYFFEFIRGFVQENRADLDAQRPGAVATVEDGLKKNVGVRESVRKWPKLLTGESLDTGTRAYQDFVKLTTYRNWLIHGKITEKIPDWERLAQECETIESAQLARCTVAAMVEMVSSRFGVSPPAWIQCRSS